jgi:hypothetical protein
MNPVSSCGQCDVDTVVDQEWHTRILERFLESPGQFHQAMALGMFVPVLDERCATRDSLPDECNRVAAACSFRVDDAVEPEIDRVHENFP